VWNGDAVIAFHPVAAAFLREVMDRRCGEEATNGGGPENSLNWSLLTIVGCCTFLGLTLGPPGAESRSRGLGWPAMQGTGPHQHAMTGLVEGLYGGIAPTDRSRLQ
jgi:hypothetical protein